MFLNRIFIDDSSILIEGGNISKLKEFNLNNYIENHFIEFACSNIIINENIFMVDLDVNKFYQNRANYLFYLKQKNLTVNMFSWIDFSKQFWKNKFDKKITKKVGIYDLEGGLVFVQLDNYLTNRYSTHLLKNIPNNNHLRCQNGIIIFGIEYDKILKLVENRLKDFYLENPFFEKKESVKGIEYILHLDKYIKNRTTYNRWLKENSKKDNKQGFQEYLLYKNNNEITIINDTNNNTTN